MGWLSGHQLPHGQETYTVMEHEVNYIPEEREDHRLG